jgi:hypothetical protein
MGLPQPGVGRVPPRRRGLDEVPDPGVPRQVSHPRLWQRLGASGERPARLDGRPPRRAARCARRRLATACPARVVQGLAFRPWPSRWLRATGSGSRAATTSWGCADGAIVSRPVPTAAGFGPRVGPVPRRTGASEGAAPSAPLGPRLARPGSCRWTLPPAGRLAAHRTVSPLLPPL